MKLMRRDELSSREALPELGLATPGIGKPRWRQLSPKEARRTRGRPPLNLYLLRRHGQMLHGNLKDDWEDEVPDWQRARPSV